MVHWGPQRNILLGFKASAWLKIDAFEQWSKRNLEIHVKKNLRCEIFNTNSKLIEHGFRQNQIEITNFI